jgi:hypothetical protein
LKSQKLGNPYKGGLFVLGRLQINPDTMTRILTNIVLPSTITTPIIMSRFLGGASKATQPRGDADLKQITVTKKTEQATLKTSDLKAYNKLGEQCMKRMDITFELLKPIDIDAKGTGLSEITSVMSKIDALKTRLKEDDTVDVFSIPSKFTLDSTSNYWKPSTSAVAIDLFTQYKDVSLDTVKKATAYFHRFGQEYHTENVPITSE